MGEKAVSNGKIHHYPPTEPLKLRKLLIISKERFKGLKEDLKRYPLEWEKGVKRKVNKRESLKDESQGILPYGKLTIDDELYSSIYTPETLAWAQDKPNWQWTRVSEWFELMAEYNCVIAKKTEAEEKSRTY